MKSVAKLLVFAVITSVSVSQGQSKHTGCNEAVAPSFMQRLLYVNQSNAIEGNTNGCGHQGVLDERYASKTLTDQVFRREIKDSVGLNFMNHVNERNLDLFIVNKTSSKNGTKKFQTVKGFSTLGD